jgi:hypothetical protein
MVSIDKVDRKHGSELVPAMLGEWNQIIRRARLSRGLKTSCFVLSSYANSDGTSVYCGVARLAVGAQCDYRTAQRHLKWLRDEGMIQLVRKGSRSGRADEYRLTLHAGIIDRPWHLDPGEEKALVVAMQEENRDKVSAGRSRSRASTASSCDDTKDVVTSGDVTTSVPGCDDTKDVVPPSMDLTFPLSTFHADHPGLEAAVTVTRARDQKAGRISLVEVIEPLIASGADAPPRPARTGIGWCVTCASVGQFTVAEDPVIGSYCATHMAAIRPPCTVTT